MAFTLSEMNSAVGHSKLFIYDFDKFGTSALSSASILRQSGLKLFATRKMNTLWFDRNIPLSYTELRLLLHETLT